MYFMEAILVLSREHKSSIVGSYEAFCDAQYYIVLIDFVPISALGGNNFNLFIIHTSYFDG